MSKNTTPRWQNPNKPVPPKSIDPAATPVKPVVKPGRNYIGPALAALGLKLPTTAAKPEGTTTLPLVLTQNQSLLAAIIVAQALDRFGEKLIDAAAVSQYRRTP